MIDAPAKGVRLQIKRHHLRQRNTHTHARSLTLSPGILLTTCHTTAATACHSHVRPRRCVQITVFTCIFRSRVPSSWDVCVWDCAFVCKILTSGGVRFKCCQESQSGTAMFTHITHQPGEGGPPTVKGGTSFLVTPLHNPRQRFVARTQNHTHTQPLKEEHSSAAKTERERPRITLMCPQGVRGVGFCWVRSGIRIEDVA